MDFRRLFCQTLLLMLLLFLCDCITVSSPRFSCVFRSLKSHHNFYIVFVVFAICLAPLLLRHVSSSVWTLYCSADRTLRRPRRLCLMSRRCFRSLIATLACSCSAALYKHMLRFVRFTFVSQFEK